MKKRKLISISTLLVIGIVILALMSCQGMRTPVEPDMVLINGKIITVDLEDTIAEAVAIKDGKIIEVGSNKEINKLIGKGTCVIDLKGHTVTPGLSDSHMHFNGITMLYTMDLNYPRVQKIADMVEIIKEEVKTLKAGEWVIGAGWDEGKIEEQRYVYASDIDLVTPDNPGFFAPGMAITDWPTAMP